MSIIQDVSLQTYDARHERTDALKRINRMSHSIETAYLLSLRSRKVDTGKYRKFLVSLEKSKPDLDLQDAVDVYIYYHQFDFEKFEKLPLHEKYETLLDTLHQGLLVIAKRLDLNARDFNSAYEEVKASNFVYQYKKGKPVLNKESGMSAQLGTIHTPISVSIVAYVNKVDGKELKVVTFIKDENPSLRFESDYLGKLKWISSNELELSPKNHDLSRIKIDLINKEQF